MSEPQWFLHPLEESGLLDTESLNEIQFKPGALALLKGFVFIKALPWLFDAAVATLGDATTRAPTATNQSNQQQQWSLE